MLGKNLTLKVAWRSKDMKISFTLFYIFLMSLAGAEPAKTFKDLPYVTNGHDHQKLDLYLPENPKGPLLVCIHGGGWREGSKNNAEGLAMLAHGYAVANIEYRFSQHAIFPAQIEDCKAAIRWLRAHAAEYGYDPARIGAWGGSAGGHLTALLATTGQTKEFDIGEHLDQSSAIRCGIDFFGPTDFPGWKPPGDIPMIQRSGAESCLEQLFGGPVDEKLELAKKASPLAWAGKETAPMFILHGTNDPLVGPEQSWIFAEKLKSLGVEVTLDIIDGAGHGGGQFGQEGRPQRMLEFLNRHLMPAPTVFRKGERILFQGDSITDGNRGRSADPNHILGHGYAFIIAAKNGAALAPLSLDFMNRGVSGNTVLDLQKRWDKDTLELKPDILSVLIGINDQGKGVPLDQYETVYDELLAKTKAANPNIRFVLCEPFSLPFEKRWKNYDDLKAEVEVLQGIVKKLAAKYDAAFVPFQGAFDDACRSAPAKHWIWDGVHPTYSGHQIMADAWDRAVLEKWSAR
jgi:acetyl esterase/lipase/lysophospholipase L1-like esterase